ncbi:MAG: LemA family protein [Lentisphaerae bacterium ADurb.BinA184]|nr:MAG: LemA family protein [Lentisphaerae bacterium ADurb.BinA184]
MTTPVWIILGVLVLAAIIVGGAYNGLVRLRNAVKNAWAQIDVQLKRRYDLIPNLVETAKGYMKHERETLESITKARNQAAQARQSGDVAQTAAAEGELNRAMASFYVVVEAYPDLKANQNFLALQEELTSTENKVSFARQSYNDSVMQYNNKTEMFPSNLIAGLFGFKKSAFFEVTEAAQREAPKVSF